MESKAELAAIDAKILKLSVLSIPGPILTGIALLGKYGEPDEIPFEFLNNDLLTSAMLVVGGLILLVTVVFIVKLGVAKANAEIRRDT
jgi:hypothetical protein